MTPTLIDFSDTNLNNSFYALAMRSAYLASGSVIIMGSSWSFYCMIGQGHQLPPKIKKNLTLGLNDKDKSGKMEGAFKQLNILRAKKRLSKEEILLMKAGENYLKAAFEVALAVLKDIIYGRGFMEINEDFLKTDYLLTLNVADEESKEQDTISMSTILLKLFDPTAVADSTIDPAFEWQVIMLPDEFFEWCEGKYTLHSAPSEAASQPDQLFMTPCFTLPNTTKLSLDEMKLANRTIRKGLAPWATAAVHWMETCTNNEPDRVNAYFAEVQIHHQAAQQTIDNNMIMEKAKQSHPAGEHLEIMLGLVPYTVMIQFYRDMKVIPDNSWEILQQAIARDEHLTTQRYPMMGVRFIGEKYFKTDTGKEGELFAGLERRKFLSVD